MSVQADQPVRAFDPVSISGLDFWATTAEEREKSFKILRDERPVSWHRPIEGALVPPEQDGVWAVTRHEHVTEVSKNPALFTSSDGVFIEAIPDDLREAAMSFLAMDGQRHASLRRLVSSAFTPKQVKTIADQIKRQAVRVVDDLLQTQEGDFVTQVSKRLPMWTIYEMIGLSPDKQEEGAHHADGMVSWADPDVAAGREPAEVLNDSLVGLLMLGLELVEERRSVPKNDLMTSLINAEVEGRKLTDDEIAAFFVLLSVAGNDTTRNTITLATMALQEFPQQRDYLKADYEARIAPAIEEMVRWATPVMSFRRTATQDVVLGGQQIRQGEWVLLLYSSANRDHRVWDDPYAFDVARDYNPHVAFGGGGPHYCMGNFLAKIQLRELFEQLLFRAPNLRLGEPDYLTGNFVRAVKSLPYTLG